MMRVKDQDSDCPEFVEVDPTGRYGRYNEILGKGASKTVYRGFDEYEGIEVAWNQVKLYDFLQSPDDLERLYCEIHLLKTLKHKNIMKFYTSWVDLSKRNINFVTEMFTSGTLRQYRQKHKRVHIRAVKHWCRQILTGLLYLHSHDPPVIHRDLKCDNIFINGNEGEVKIGDLGLAAILRKSHAVHCVGTPEFMAPEVYEEEYNELVDIYSFGMCVLEMVMFEYPYSECTHPAQIYKKVISGTKPDALYRVKDPVVREFIEKCLATASHRLSARELLRDPFLQTDGLGSGSWEADIISLGPILRQPSCSSHHSNGHLIADGSSDELECETEADNDWDDNSADLETRGISLFNSNEDEDEPFANVGISIKGKKGEDGGIFIRLRIGNREGKVRNIYFPFDIDADTALGVAAEMVDELDITDHEVTRIAEMIDGEVSSLVPQWKADLEYLVMNDSCCDNLHPHYSDTNCDQKERAEDEELPILFSSKYDVTSQGSEDCQSDEDCDQSCHQANKETKIVHTGNGMLNETRSSQDQEQSSELKTDDFENKVPQDTKWLKLMYRMRVKDFRNRLLRHRKSMNLPLDLDNKDPTVGEKAKAPTAPKPMKSFHLGTRFSFKHPDLSAEYCIIRQPHEQAEKFGDQETNPSNTSENNFEPKNYYIGYPLPKDLPRARSLCI